MYSCSPHSLVSFLRFDTAVEVDQRWSWFCNGFIKTRSNWFWFLSLHWSGDTIYKTWRNPDQTELAQSTLLLCFYCRHITAFPFMRPAANPGNFELFVVKVAPKRPVGEKIGAFSVMFSFSTRKCCAWRDQNYKGDQRFDMLESVKNNFTPNSSGMKLDFVIQDLAILNHHDISHWGKCYLNYTKIICLGELWISSWNYKFNRVTDTENLLMMQKEAESIAMTTTE